jgi:Capsule polysaccharide biosynthesis protein
MMKIAVYAFSTSAYFFRKLIETYGDGDVEWSVIVPRGHYLRLFDRVVPSQRVCYLYAGFDESYAAASSQQIGLSAPAGESIYVALAKDKDGYRHLEKDEQLRRAKAIYAVYRDFLQRIRPDYILTPDPETVDGFVLFQVCSELGIQPISYVGLRLLNGVVFSNTCYENLPCYFGEFGPSDLQRGRQLLAQVRNGGVGSLASLTKQRAASLSGLQPAPSLPVRAMKSIWRAWTTERLHAGEDNFWQKVRTVIKPAVYCYRAAKFRLLQSRYFDIGPDLDKLPRKFVFYALQYTPESSINGLEPYYVDQLRVIDRLLLSLPNGYFLLVKEHPAMRGERSAAFYRVLRKRAGVVLVHPDANTPALIGKADLVCTVTGTIGLECFFLEKPCLMFGRSFFAHLCYAFDEWGRHRDFVERILRHFRPRTDEEKAIELARLFNVSYEIEISGLFSTKDDLSDNAVRAYWLAVNSHISRLKVMNEESQHA